MEKRDIKTGSAGPRLDDPFTGKRIEIEFLPAIGQYRAKGPDGFWVTRWYENEGELLYDLSVRHGVPPAFPRHPKVVVKDREPPPSDPAAGMGTPVGQAKIEEVVR